MPLGTSRTEQGSGADALQLTLRFSFRARLTASVGLLGDILHAQHHSYVCHIR
jgi:hypothetical protein